MGWNYRILRAPTSDASGEIREWIVQCKYGENHKPQEYSLVSNLCTSVDAMPELIRRLREALDHPVLTPSDFCDASHKTDQQKKSHL